MIARLRTVHDRKKAPPCSHYAYTLIFTWYILYITPLKYILE